MPVHSLNERATVRLRPIDEEECKTPRTVEASANKRRLRRREELAGVGRAGVRNPYRERGSSEITFAVTITPGRYFEYPAKSVCLSLT